MHGDQDSDWAFGSGTCHDELVFIMREASNRRPGSRVGATDEILVWLERGIVVTSLTSNGAALTPKRAVVRVDDRQAFVFVVRRDMSALT